MKSMAKTIEIEVATAHEGNHPADGSNTEKIKKEEHVSTSQRTRKRRLDADLLTRQEIESLIRVCSPRAATGIRNRALIAVSWRCGLRIGETLALLHKDVDLDNGTLIVQHGKNDKRRVLGIDAGTTELIRRWIAVKQKRRLPARSPLFCTLQGAAIDQSYVRHLLPRLANRAGIEKRVHAHGLRHTFAVELEAEGAVLSTIRDALGHSSAAVTDRYLQRVSGSAATAFVRERSWSPSDTTS